MADHKVLNVGLRAPQPVRPQFIDDAKSLLSAMKKFLQDGRFARIRSQKNVLRSKGRCLRIPHIEVAFNITPRSRPRNNTPLAHGIEQGLLCTLNAGELVRASQNSGALRDLFDAKYGRSRMIGNLERLAGHAKTQRRCLGDASIGQ
jgi:hypothetical protein